jgi:hypothetical protein
MADGIKELRKQLKELDSNFYDQLDKKTKKLNDDAVMTAIRESLQRADESFKKVTPEGNMQGIVYRRIAKNLMETL